MSHCSFFEETSSPATDDKTQFILVSLYESRVEIVQINFRSPLNIIIITLCYVRTSLRCRGRNRGARRVVPQQSISPGLAPPPPPSITVVFVLILCHTKSNVILPPPSSHRSLKLYGLIFCITCL